MAQYGSFQNFTWDQLESAKNARNNLKKKIKSYLSVDRKEINESVLNLSLSEFESLSNLEFGEDYYQESQDFIKDGISAICDNLNMPQLFASINKATLSIKKSISFLYYLDEKLLKL
jgi:cysteinyl-tRNA synthetase